MIVGGATDVRAIADPLSTEAHTTSATRLSPYLIADLLIDPISFRISRSCLLD
jgi:hypothetical protein